MKITKILQARKTIQTRKSIFFKKNTPTENRDVKIIKKYTPRKTIQTRKSKLSKTYSHRKQGRQNCQTVPTPKNDTSAAQTRKSKLSKAYTHRKQGRQTYQKNTHTEKLYKRCVGQQAKTCNYQKKYQCSKFTKMPGAIVRCV